MTLLIDTHVFIWWTSSDRRLKPSIINYIGDPGNEVFVSPVSILEIATKRRLGKLDFKHSVTEAIENSGFLHLPIVAEDAEHAGSMVWGHKDPFDRLLVAQAANHSYTLVTADAEIRAYSGVSILWAG